MIASLLFVENTVLLASSNQDLQCSLSCFAAQYKAMGGESALLNLRPLFSTEKRMSSGVQDGQAVWCFICGDVFAVSISHGEEGAELKAGALNFANQSTFLP